MFSSSSAVKFMIWVVYVGWDLNMGNLGQVLQFVMQNRQGRLILPTIELEIAREGDRTKHRKNCSTFHGFKMTENALNRRHCRNLRTPLEPSRHLLENKNQISALKTSWLSKRD